MPTVSEIIDIAAISQGYAGNDIAKQGLYGGGTDIQLPRKLYAVRKNVEWLYDIDPTDTTLIPTSNFLYALCGKYKFKAQAAIASGGSVAPITPPSSSLPYPLDFIVDGASFIPTGGTTVNIPQYIGYNLSFDRNNQPQNTTNPGDSSSYYSWDRVTGDFALLNGAAQATERFRLTPIG